MHNLYPGGGGGNILLTYWDKRGSISNTCYLLLVSQRWLQTRAWHNCIKISLFPIASHPNLNKTHKNFPSSILHQSTIVSHSSAIQPIKTAVLQTILFLSGRVLITGSIDFLALGCANLLYVTHFTLGLYLWYIPDNLDSKWPELSNQSFLKRNLCFDFLKTNWSNFFDSNCLPEISCGNIFLK